MCPLCIGTATLIVSGGTSAGGLATVVLMRLGRKPREGVSRVSPAAMRGSLLRIMKLRDRPTP